MEEIILFIAFGLSIAAMFMARGAIDEVKRLREELHQLKSRNGPPPIPTAPRKPTPFTVETPAAPPTPLPAKQELKTADPASNAKPAPPRAQTPPPAPPKNNLEVTLGGKVASFIGMGALLLGVVFFVGYAIQHGWIGPAMRIVLGLVFGGVLIALGHLAETKGTHLSGFARVLTGGGAALLFFSVFAAYGIYQLIGAWMAGTGLVLVSVAVLALSVAYRSLIVALIGVLGAFLTPAFIGGDFTQGLFSLVYIGAVNAMVMALGVKRNWQSLYNVAFFFTALYTTMWLNEEVGGLDHHWIIGLCASFFFFAEFIALGLIKLKGEREDFSQALDMGRMLLSSLLLLGAIYYILDYEDLNAWIGGAFLLTALGHVLLVKIAWRWLPRFKHDILVLLAGALTFATLALPAQLDGVWVSLGWSLEGFALAWLGMRFRVRPFRTAGIFLGLLGLGKAIVFDLTLMEKIDTQLFLNSRFIVGLASAALLAGQAFLRGSKTEEDPASTELTDSMENLLLTTAALGFIFAIGSDAVFLLGVDAPWAWLCSSVALGLAGVFLLLMGGRRTSSTLWGIGIGLLILLPIKIILWDLSWGWDVYDNNFTQFLNSFFWVGMVLVMGAGLGASRLAINADPEQRSTFPADAILHIVSLASGILLVTIEISRAQTAWKDSAITLWWGSCALVLIFLGLRTGKQHLRWTALALFGCTIGKMFLVDLAELHGLIRVAAFMGVGVLLLVLSFTYQRLAPKLTGNTNENPPPTIPDPNVATAESLPSEKLENDHEA